MATSHILTVHPDQQRALEAIAADQRRSPEDLLHAAVDHYLRIHHEQQSYRADDFFSPEELAQIDADADASAKHYEETGLHLTHDEVHAWVEKIKAGEIVPMPECHI